MKVIIGISHPKLVYIYLYLIKKLIKEDNRVIVLVSDKEMVVSLLENFGIDYIKLGSNKKNIVFKIIQLIMYFFKSLYISIKYKPDIYLGVGDIYLAICAKLLCKPYIMVEDTEGANFIIKMMIKLANVIITSEHFKLKLGAKQIKLKTTLEYAYLHPNKFKPDKTVLEDIQLSKKEKFIFIRFVAWTAHHDFGHKGLSENAKRKAINEFSKYGKVFVSAEYELPKSIEKYKLDIPIHKIHSLEYYASLFFGESPTITTESALLGTPSICVSSMAYNKLGNFDELKAANLSYSYKPEDENKAIEKAIEILKDDNAKAFYKKKAEEFARKHIDLTEFLFWFITNYPESKKAIKNKPEIQYRFM